MEPQLSTQALRNLHFSLIDTMRDSGIKLIYFFQDMESGKFKTIITLDEYNDFMMRLDICGIIFSRAYRLPDEHVARLKVKEGQLHVYAVNEDALMDFNPEFKQIAEIFDYEIEPGEYTVGKLVY